MKLRIAHYPQIPCTPFYVNVESLEQAWLVQNTLANYDCFQLDNNIKPDYANMTLLEEYLEESKEWVAWVDAETGIDDLAEYFSTVD